MSRSTLLALAKEMHYDDVDALYAAIGEHKEQPADVVARMVEAVGGQEGADEDITEITRPGTARTARRGDPGVSVHGLSDVVVKLSKCCTPVPGDAIQGFVTRGQGVSVHRADCDNLASLREQQPERLIDVQWTGQHEATYMVQIEVEALDRNRLLSDVVQVLSDHHVNILGAHVSTNKDRVALNTFTFEMADPSHLGAVLGAVRRIEGVYDARRVTGTLKISAASAKPGDARAIARSAVSTAPAAPRPMTVRNGMPATPSPTRAIMTVIPAKTTAVPAVAMATATDSAESIPCRRLSRCREVIRRA